MRVPLAIASALAASACTVSVTFPVGLGCKDGACPEGQVCVAETCVADPAAGDGGVGADADVGARQCGGSVALALDFASANQAFFFDTLPAGASTASELSLPSDGQDVFASMGSRLDLIESEWIARVDPAAQGSTSLRITDGAETLAVRIAGGSLFFEKDYVGEAELAYDPIAHHHVGFRERGGRVDFVTSPDGATLTSRHSVATSPFIRRFQPVMVIEPGGAAAEAIFDDINTARPPHAFCQATDLSDDFGDGQISDRWSLFGCTSATEVGGEIVLVAAQGQFCVLSGNNFFDLRGSKFEFELGSVFSGYYKLAVSGEFGELRVERFDTELRVTDCPNDMCGAPVAAPYAGERFLRIEGSEDGLLSVSFSGDGIDFQTVATTPARDVSVVAVRFHGNTGSENRVTRIN